MARVTTDDRHYSALAAALRTSLGTEATYRPEDMAPAVPAVYDAGAAAGKAEAEQTCAMQHFVTVLTGSGETSLSFHVPFPPDLLVVTGYDPTVLATDYQVMMFVYDIAAFGLMGGYMLTSCNQSAYSLAMTTVSALTRYARADDGTVTLGNIRGNNSHPVGTFGAAVQYTVTAVKYTNRTDKERITEMVEGLTGSGSLTLNRAKVNGAFTDEEWAALIATKPDWTFAFVG